MPIDGVVMDDVVWCAPGYYVTPAGLAVLHEGGEGAREKLEVVKGVEVQQGAKTWEVLLVAGSSLVVGVAGGMVLDAVLD